MWECCFVNVHLAQDIFNIEYSQFSPLSTLNIFNSEYLCGSSVTFVNAHLALDIFNSEWTPSEHILEAQAGKVFRRDPGECFGKLLPSSGSGNRQQDNCQGNGKVSL